MRTFYVYVHTNKANGKKYIGITSQIPSHRWRNGKGYKHCIKFYHAILYYGWDGFYHEVLFEGLIEAEAHAKEIELIKEFRTTEKEYGYNITLGGSGTLYYETEEERLEAIRAAGRKHAAKRAADPETAAKDAAYMKEYSKNYYLKTISDEKSHEKHKEAMRGYSAKRYADPIGHEKMLESSRLSHQRRMQDPATRAKMNNATREIKAASRVLRRELIDLYNKYAEIFTQTDIDYIFTKYENGKGYKYNSKIELEKILNSVKVKLQKLGEIVA